VFYDREEGPYTENGLGPLLAGGHVPKLSAAICLEPTDNRIEMGCVGSLHATVRFRGQAAHSARPWEGKNAVLAATPLLARLASLERKAVQRGGLTFYEVTQPTFASGGRARNVVPDLFELNLNYRFAPGTSLEQAKARVADLVGDGEIEFTDLSPSGPSCEGNPELQRLRAAGVPVEAKQAWTDVARFGVHGIDAVNFGPGNPAQAHQVDEWCESPALARAFELLQAWLVL
jgi:succinyl-diaminopimelate desuccinylase